MSSTLAVNIPSTAVVLPSNVRFSGSGKDLVIQKVKRRVRRFKMPKAQREKISRAAKQFKWPIVTTIALAPSALIAANFAFQRQGLVNQFSEFSRRTLLHYTGIWVFEDGRIAFLPRFAAIGWGPIFGVMAAKKIARGTLMKLNRAASQAKLPANFT